MRTKNDSKGPKVIAKLGIDGGIVFHILLGELRAVDKLKDDVR